MDPRELHPGICYKLYLFIMETLASQAMKTVTLGTPSNYGSWEKRNKPLQQSESLSSILKLGSNLNHKR
ncbi:hypothetical protein VNO80_29706 [Phaseolus coccineus]|uniref:Uncharacterized protein n=1 Tax=Phaseolus coccineus TaxID=3886 RepID=A0AAN9LEV8_PHACN